MNMFSKLNKKAQALPLNTIVIAMLVIIVLLVIIVFFTSSVGKTGDQLNDNSVSACSLSNPAINTLGYKDVDWGSVAYDSKSAVSCEGTKEIISFISLKEEKINGETQYRACCGDKN